jgi:hypothetical protein
LADLQLSKAIESYQRDHPGAPVPAAWLRKGDS